MNSVLRIRVQVLNGASPEIKAIQAQMIQMARAVEQATAAMNAQTKLSARSMTTLSARTAQAAVAQRSFARALTLTNLEKYGKNLQWTGRQIEFNFTLPLLLAGAVATKWALENEKALTRVSKVYGDQVQAQKFWMKQGLTANQAQAKATQVFEQEVAALNQTFIALSDTYGIAQKDVINLAADWAAAGASGLRLAKITKLTIETMILGEMEQAEATKALISIQAQYGAGVKDLTNIIMTLNNVENSTGATMNDLIDGFTRAAGAARTAGVDYRHLAAMVAALTPAAGSATTAGNALRTIFSRLLSPTGDAAELMGLLGINTNDASWASKNATQRLIALAKATDGLTQQQKAVVSTYVASRYQVNRFDILMEALIKKNSFYAAALENTNTQLKLTTQYQRELSAVLESNPQQFQMVIQQIKNAMSTAIIPFIPAILSVLHAIADLAQGFANLDPRLQKLIVAVLVGIAVFGTLTRLLGAFILLVTRLGATVAFVAKALYALVRLKWLVAIFLDLRKIVFLTGAAFAWLLTPFKWLWMGMVAIAGPALAALRTVMIYGWTAMIAAVKALWVGWLAFWKVFWTLFATAGGIISGVVWPSIMGAMTAGFARFRAFMSLIYSTWILVWASLGGVTGILTSVWTAILGLFSAAYSALLVMTVAFRTWFFRTFASIAGLTALWGRFWAGIVAIYKGAIVAIRLLGPALMAALTSPWTAVLAIVAIILYSFRDQVAGFIRDVIDGFHSLPGAVASAMAGVIRVLAAAARQVVEWLSYLNPFARHSPSLVDNVKAGAGAIQTEHRGMAGTMGSTMGEATKHTRTISKAAGDANRAVSAVGGRTSGPAAIVAGSGAAASSSDALTASQQALARAVEAVNRRLEQEQWELKQLQYEADRLKKTLDEHQAALDSYLSAPLKGEKAMNKAILDNQIAQAKMNLQMMKIEDAIGPIDEARSKVAAMNGELELLNGQQAALRAAGAGSEILGQYDDEIKAVERQKKGFEGQLQQYERMQERLEELQRTAQKLDLRKFLHFDAVHQQMEMLADTSKELSAKEIREGIIKESRAVERLTEKYNRASEAVDQQQRVVDRLQHRHDMLIHMLGGEEKAMKAMGDAADAASSDVQKLFSGAGTGNFDDAGLGGGLGQRSNWRSQKNAIDRFTQQTLDNATSAFDGLDMLGPFKEMWYEGIAWLQENTSQGVQDFVNGIFDNLKNSLAGAGIGAAIGALIGGPIGAAIGAAIGTAVGSKLPEDFLPTLGKGISDIAGKIGNAIGNVIELIQKLARAFWGFFGENLTRLWEKVKKFFGDLVDVFRRNAKEFNFDGIGDALQNIAKVIKVIAGVLFLPLLAAWKLLAPPIIEVIGALFDTVIGILDGALKILAGMIDVFIGVFTGDWGRIKEGILKIWRGIWTAVKAVLRGAFQALKGIVKGLVRGIVDFFKWLYDTLVGHSIIPDLVKKIVEWFKWMIDPIKKVWKAIWEVIKFAWNNIIKPIFKAIIDFIRNVLAPVFHFLWDNVIKPIWDKIGEAIKNAWENVIHPVFDKLKSAVDNLKSGFRTLKTAISAAWDGIKGAIAVPVNFVIEKIYTNGLKALFDKVASAVGLSWELPEIDPIPGYKRGGPIQTARGAVMGAGTGTSDSILARLSRGEHVWTAKEVKNAGGHAAVARLRRAYGRGDPSPYRLMRADRDHLGPDIPGFFLGGAWDWVKDKAGDAKDWAVTKSLDWVAGMARDTINTVMDMLPDTVVSDIGRATSLSFADKVLRWAAEKAGTDWDSPIASGGAGIQRALEWVKGEVGKPYGLGGVGPGSYDCSGLMSAITNVIRGKNPHSRVGTTGTWPWAGFNVGSRGGFTIGSTPAYPGSSMGHMAGTLGGINVESSSGYGVHMGSSARGWNDPGFTSYGSINGFANGAYVRRRAGGVLALVGEGRYDEAVVPLPHGIRSSVQKGASVGGETHLHFHGDLSFPNITDPDDAMKLIENLEALAEEKAG